MLQPVTTATPLTYASLLRRYQALIFDALIVMPLFIAALFLPEILGLEPAATQVVFMAALGACVIYEPIQVSLRRGTLGHYRYGLRVQDASSGKRLGFLRALGRSSLKGLLGIFSFLFLLATRRAQSLHDLVFRSVVVIADPARATSLDVAAVDASPAEGLPSRGRRVAVIIAWSIASLLAWVLAESVLFSADCLDLNECTAGERAWSNTFGAAWIVAWATILSLGWRGRLLGARRRSAGGS
jgi:uncharacterized RDD family membrane protein YckC